MAHVTVVILVGERSCLSRISSAFRSFFSILFSGVLPEDIAAEFGFERPKPLPQPLPVVPVSDGALQLLQILQRDSRIVDFLMEDISGYDDDQVGAAVRTVHNDCRASLTRLVQLSPVFDGVEGTFQKLDGQKTPDANRIKLLGNVPASGKTSGGTLRHRGWRATSITLPAAGKADVTVIAPAEIEVE
jgi:Domain of unknown function (DUF2760)